MGMTNSAMSPLGITANFTAGFEIVCKYDLLAGLAVNAGRV